MRFYQKIVSLICSMIAFRFIVGLTLSMCLIACTQVSNNQDNTTRGDGEENQKSSSKLRVAAAANLRFVRGVGPSSLLLRFLTIL